MITLQPTIDLIFYSEMVLLLVSLILLIKEILLLKDVIRHSASLSLLGFLIGIWSMTLCRFIGIYYDNILIRTYLTSIFGLMGTLAFINWVGIVSQISDNARRFSFLGLIFGMTSFLVIRSQHNSTLEILVIIFMITILLYSMVLVMRFVFTTSPYLRSRHRLFLLTVSFVLFAIFEGIGVYHMGQGNYILAMNMFLLQIPCRVGITLSIILPPRVTNFLRKIII